jgi:creatinine amidohydrolase/Fe(II)-dependent formamide hydrolase-like protein
MIYSKISATLVLMCCLALYACDAGESDPAEGEINTLFIEEMTWTEVRDAIAAGKSSVIVAAGGVEQNGPFVVTGKHNYVLRATTKAIAEKLGNTLIAPIIKFVPEGNIDPPSGHMEYPGTISLREETFKLLLIDIASSLKQHDFTDIFFIADSGGNVEGMKEVAEILNEEWDAHPASVHYISEYYEEDIWSYDYLKKIGVHQQPDVKDAMRQDIHSDYHYEAMIATVDPQLIRTSQRIATGKYSINDFDMNPPGKTIENGKKLVEYRANITVKAIRKILSVKD